MVEIVQKQWNDLDYRILAEITSETQRQENLGDYTIDQVEEYLINMNERFPIEIVLLAIERERIRGWLGFERVTENIGELNRWHPFVVQDAKRDDIARRLISEINNYARENGISRMEIGFGRIDENNLVTYEKRCSWYESEGWSKLDDSNFMAIDPTKVMMKEPSKVDRVEFQPLLDFDNGTLYTCYHDAFTTGQASWIYDMSEEEKRQAFEKSFDRSQKINDRASLVAMKDGEIVGFVLVKTRSDEEEHLESIGVHSSIRGNGLGKLMLWRILQVLASENVNNLTLGVDPVNTPAVNLYEKFGFRLVSRTASYSWKAN